MLIVSLLKSSRSALLGLTALTALSLATPVAAEFKPGDTAPEIDVTKWVKGEKVDLKSLLGKKIVVLEFWAVWCPPCIAAMPHLTQLQKKHEKDVVFIGVTAKDPRNPLDRVEGFVKERGDQIGYRIAFDGFGKTYGSYMRASKTRGIPATFIIDRTGKLAWKGHPMSMDLPLQQIIDGTYDPKKAALQQVAQKAYAKFYWARQKKQFDEAAIHAEKFVEISDNPQYLNVVAWSLLTEDGFKGKSHDVALKAAQRCHELTRGEQWMFLDTLALAKFETGAHQEALEYQKAAVDRARKSKAKPKQLAEMEQRLTEFEARLK